MIKTLSILCLVLSVSFGAQATSFEDTPEDTTLQNYLYQKDLVQRLEQLTYRIEYLDLGIQHWVQSQTRSDEYFKAFTRKRHSRIKSSCSQLELPEELVTEILEMLSNAESGVMAQLTDLESYNDPQKTFLAMDAATQVHDQIRAILTKLKTETMKRRKDMQVAERMLLKG